MTGPLKGTLQDPLALLVNRKLAKPAILALMISHSIIQSTGLPTWKLSKSLLQHEGLMSVKLQQKNSGPGGEPGIVHTP